MASTTPAAPNSAPASPGPLRFAVLGGSAPATVQLVDALADWRDPIELVLHGRSPVRLNAVARASRLRAAALGTPVTVVAEPDRATALTGALVVLNQIRAGGLAERSADESFPRAFGIPGEETLGPGGFACAVRTVLALRPVWADVTRLAPDALIMNLTNPAGIVAHAARLAFGLNVISVCDSPIDLLARVAARLGGTESDPVAARYVGMNHVGWYVPRSAAELDLLAGVSEPVDPGLPALHGAIPTSYLRYYAHPDLMLAAQAGQPTRADELTVLARDAMDGYRRGELPASWRRAAPWYALAVVPLASAWLRGSDTPLIVGLPNAGRIAWLPDDVTVEGPALVSAGGRANPLPVVELPDLPRGLLARHAAYERLTAIALAGADIVRPTDLDLTRALLANPLVTSLDKARELTAAVVARMNRFDPLWR